MTKPKPIKQQVTLAYKCGHRLTKLIELHRIDLEVNFAPTIKCADCYRLNKQLLETPKYRTIIAGSHTILDFDELLQAIGDAKWEISTVLCSESSGIDRLGEVWARESHVPIEYYPANWNKYGKSAGIIRNTIMANKADALIAVWDGASLGTRYMIEVAKKENIKVHVHMVDIEENGTPF